MYRKRDGRGRGRGRRDVGEKRQFRDTRIGIVGSRYHVGIGTARLGREREVPYPKVVWRCGLVRYPT